MRILTYWINQFINAKRPGRINTSTYCILFKWPKIEVSSKFKNASHIEELSHIFQPLLMSLRMKFLTLQDRLIISKSIHMQTPKNRKGFISQEINRVRTISSLFMAQNRKVEFNMSWNKKKLKGDRKQTFFLKDDLSHFPMQSIWTISLMFANDYIRLLNGISSCFLADRYFSSAYCLIEGFHVGLNKSTNVTTEVTILQLSVELFKYLFIHRLGQKPSRINSEDKARVCSICTIVLPLI